MRDHFEKIERDRKRRREPELHEVLIALLHEHERRSGVVQKIIAAQDRVKKVLGQKNVKLLLDLETLYTDRVSEAEVVAFNFAFELGVAHGRARNIEDVRVGKLVAEIGEHLAAMDARPNDVVEALAVVIASILGGEREDASARRRRARGS